MSERPNIIEVRNVYKYFRMGDEVIKALDGVSLEIKKGEVCCILGTSGSGKSTLLNMMAGLEKPSKGEVIIKSAKIHMFSETKLALFRQKNIGFVFQSYNLLSTLTALENVTLPLIFSRTPKRVRNKRAYEMLKAVGLEKRWRHKPAEMSGGQQQRVSIARAFINKPDVVFCDEPTGNLDTKTTKEMMDLITGMAKEHDQTLIIVTHDPELSRYANRIIKIKDGKVEYMKEVTEAEQLSAEPEAEEPEQAEEESAEAAEAEPQAAEPEAIEPEQNNEIEEPDIDDAKDI